MNKNRDRRFTYINSLYDFRSRIPTNLSKGKVKDIWDISIKDRRFVDISDSMRSLIERKLSIVRENLYWILFKPFVKFVGVSGSIASEFVNDDDDIDLFIVVRNDTAWIYRLYLYFRNSFKKLIRSRNNQKDVKDKLCINFIVEERALYFEPEMFNLNELVFLKPVFNKKYLNLIFLVNSWLKTEYLVSEKFLGINKVKMGMLKPISKRNYLFFVINVFCFIGQVMFMYIMKHEPEFQRLLQGFRNGRIEFYPQDFKSRVYSDL